MTNVIGKFLFHDGPSNMSLPLIIPYEFTNDYLTQNYASNSDLQASLRVTIDVFNTNFILTSSLHFVVVN